jgi:hypothetical protein
MKQAIIAVAVCCALFAVLSYAQNSSPGQQHFVMSITADGNIAWRMNQTTGEVSYCKFGAQTCSSWMKQP